MQTIDILERLIAFPTVSRDSNRDLMDFVSSFLEERGVSSELILAEGGRKANLIATIGPTDRAGVMLSGHTDVVPVEGQAWSCDPFRLHVRDGRAYGRGAADMKGFVAACLRLADLASKAELEIPLHLALSHDEEVGCIGVRALIERVIGSSLRPRFCIVGEPTSMRLATGHKGKVAARATCCGVEAHSALAPRGLNAIHIACDFVGHLKETQSYLAEHGTRDDAYDVPYTTVHVGRIEGGTALNIVPNRCTLDFEIRNIAEDNANEILKRIEAFGEILEARERTRFPDAGVSVEVLNSYPGLQTPESAEVVNFVRQLVEDPTTTKVAFGTEGGLFASRLGLPTLICGPGSMEQGHKPDEFVSLDQLAACDRMMERLLEKLRG